MFNLLIVEDDPIILNRLKQNFDWESLGYTVCGTAGDGQSALRLIPVLKPDVILTDVEMPIVSGLELAKEVNRLHYPIKIIFLSAHDEFRYAREAFRLGAVDYLLKPLNRDDVTQLFLQIAEELEKGRQTFPSGQLPQVSTEDSLRQVIFDYLTGQPSDPNHVRFLLQHFGLAGYAKYTLCAFCFMETQTLEDVRTALADFCSENRSKPLLFVHQHHFVLLIPGVSTQAMSFMRDFLVSSHNWQCVLTRQACLSELPCQFAQLWNQPCGWFYFPTEEIILLPGQVSGRSSNSDNSLPESNHYFSLIKDQNQPRFLHLLNTHANLCRTQQMDVDLCMIHMAQTYVKTASQLQSYQPKLVAESFSDLFRKFQSCFCFQGLETLFREHMVALMENYAQLCDQKGDLIYQVQSYIQKHYAENLTLASLSSKFYVSTAYLSHLYSQRTKTTITEYLQKVRMEQAALLLRETNLSIAEIGTAVGYGNYKNFWKLFKRYFNITPKEYRNIHNA